tara:strand:- start:55 stop:990 length:936 start_codon:yes stop_codon:yes gene_type:complete
MAINAALAAGLGLTSTIGGMVQTLGGKEKQREAEKASAKYASEIENLRAKNLMEGVAIPMRGFDLAKEAQAQRYATGVAALQSAGAEGVLGGLTRLERQQGQQDLALASQLEKMEYARNLERARQAQNIENQAIGRQAQLNFMRLQGAGQAAAEGARQQQAGIQSIIGGLGTAAELGLKYAPLYGKDKGMGSRQQRKAEGLAKQRVVNETGVGAIAPLQPMGGDEMPMLAPPPTAENTLGYMGPYSLYNPPQGPSPANLHTLWDPTTNPFQTPYAPQYGPFGGSQLSFQNPYTAPSMNIGSGSWLGGNNYP